MTLFERDEAKAESNRRKHGIDFDDAIEVFYDLHALVEQDRILDGELRWRTIGMVRGTVCMSLTPSESGTKWKSFESFRHDWLIERSVNGMGRIVRKAWGESRISDERLEELRKLAERPDSEIDLSDMPELTEKFWQNAVHNPWYKPVKKQVTLRIDADILAWLRQQGSTGYQSRLNAVLRQVMLQDLETKRKRA